MYREIFKHVLWLHISPVDFEGRSVYCQTVTSQSEEAFNILRARQSMGVPHSIRGFDKDIKKFYPAVTID